MSSVMSTTPEPLISEEQIARYHRDGYVIPNFRIPDDTLARMRPSWPASCPATATTITSSAPR